MDNNNNQNVEQQILQELEKLKKIVKYFEDIKDRAANSSQLLEKINSENTQLQNAKIDFTSLKEQLESTISKNNKAVDNKLAGFRASLNKELMNKSQKIENRELETSVASVKTKIKNLRTVTYISLTIIIAILIRLLFA